MSPYARVLDALSDLRKDHEKLADELGKEKDKRIELEMRFVELKTKFVTYVSLFVGAIGIGVHLVSKWIH